MIIFWVDVTLGLTSVRGGSRIFCRGGGGGGGQRRPCRAGAGFGARAEGGGRGSRVEKHQIKVHSVHRIFRAIFFCFFFCYRGDLVKKFVEKKIGGREQGGHDPQPPPPGSAPASVTTNDVNVIHSPSCYYR